MSSISVNTITDASGGATTSINGFTPSVSNMAGRNRIINGDMRIDQRNAGASITFDGSNKYVTDRFFGFSNVGTTTAQQSTVAPAGFNNSLLVTQTTGGSVVSSSYIALQHRVEGFNTADLGWGTASAQTVTLSFWVRSSITGAFSVALNNSASNRSYVSNYTINAANTWEQKTITVTGDTSGTWLTNNGLGISLVWNFGYGSNYTTSTLNSWLGSGAFGSTTATTAFATTSGATWQITGVQLEAGSVATPFEHRQYGQELALCQRYYQTTYSGVAVGTPATTLNQLNGWALVTSTNWTQLVTFTCAMRTQPTVTIYNPNSGATGSARINGTVDAATAATAPTTLNTVVYSSASITAGHNVNYHYTSSAEL